MWSVNSKPIHGRPLSGCYGTSRYHGTKAEVETSSLFPVLTHKAFPKSHWVTSPVACMFASMKTPILHKTTRGTAFERASCHETHGYILNLPACMKQIDCSDSAHQFNLPGLHRSQAKQDPALPQSKDDAMLGNLVPLHCQHHSGSLRKTEDMIVHQKRIRKSLDKHADLTLFLHWTWRRHGLEHTAPHSACAFLPTSSESANQQ